MFQFKQFIIHQERTAMKVGTDGVLLGAWAELESASTILDVGTGTGLLALMVAQRNSQAMVDAVEIEPDAAAQAMENVANSPWSDRVKVYNTSIFHFSPFYKYDCILCNPPFFTNSTKASYVERTLARHSDTLPHKALIETVLKLLTEEGRFYIILPPEEADIFIKCAEERQLYLAKLTYVLPNPGKKAKRYLMKFTCMEDMPVETNELIIELARHQYSADYIRLTKAFYLNM